MGSTRTTSMLVDVIGNEREGGRAPRRSGIFTEGLIYHAQERAARRKPLFAEAIEASGDGDMSAMGLPSPLRSPSIVSIRVVVAPIRATTRASRRCRTCGRSRRAAEPPQARCPPAGL